MMQELKLSQGAATLYVCICHVCGDTATVLAPPGLM